MVDKPLVDYDWAFPDFTARIKALEKQGFRLRSLSMFGHPAKPRFTAVWRRGTRPWRWYLSYTLADFQMVAAKAVAAGLHASLVTATGQGEGTRYSGVFEPFSFPTAVTFAQSVEGFEKEVLIRADVGWMVRSAAIHDGYESHEPPLLPPVGPFLKPPRVTTVWERNRANVAWNAFVRKSVDEQQELFDIMHGGWARPVLMTASTMGWNLSVFRDDQVGPIGQGFEARGELTKAAFLSHEKTLLADGLWAGSVHGHGVPGKHRHTAIFVRSDRPVALEERITGTPAVGDIDEAVLGLMRRSNIRGASLAVVQDTRLILARGYTRAEPDYPTVQPSTPFRLASCSKLVAALALHQLLAEGNVSATDKLPDVLPLAPPPGGATSPLFEQATVGDLLSNECQINPAYEERDAEITDLFGALPPATPDQLARWLSANATPPDEPGPNDGGFFLAGELVRRRRNLPSLMSAVETGINGPLHIKRLRSSRTAMSDQPADEARHHPRWLVPARSVMSADQPMALRGYGEANLETMTASGGMSAAAPDLARLLAAMNARPYTPLGRTVVDSLLAAAVVGEGGHGFDGLVMTDAAHGRFHAWKGGMLNVAQSGLYYQNGRTCYVILWNSNHTGTRLTGLDPAIGHLWYGIFHEVLDAVAAHTWPAGDLFPDYGMPSLPQTHGGWRRCRDCAGLFHPAPGVDSCPDGGPHTPSGATDHTLMLSSALGYGQDGWRWCVKCAGLFFTKNGSGVCPAGAGHKPSPRALSAHTRAISLVHNSPYREHQRNWRWCSRCQGLWFAGRLALPGPRSGGRCPTGGAHTGTGSGDYAIAVA